MKERIFIKNPVEIEYIYIYYVFNFCRSVA
jgi:hypothetical protein